MPARRVAPNQGNSRGMGKVLGHTAGNIDTPVVADVNLDDGYLEYEGVLLETTQPFAVAKKVPPRQG